MKTTIYFNPECSKCNEGLCILEEHGEDIEIRNYLKDIPTVAEIELLIQQLQIEPLDLIRKNEPIFKTNFINKDLTHKEWIQVMVDHPILIERPIVVRGNKAIIGRPPSIIRSFIV